jgi:hypothetical protein
LHSAGLALLTSVEEVVVVAEGTYYVPVNGRQTSTGGFSPGRAAGWLALLGTLVFMALTAYVSWNWLNAHIFSIGIQDAGQVTVNEAELLQRVQAFEIVTVKNTYDSRSHTEFKKRLNTGFTQVSLPGWIAGQELDVAAQVTVAAGVDLSQLGPQDIRVIQQGQDAVVVIRIPEAQVTSTEINAGSFDISTNAGVLTRFRRTIGLGERDVRDASVGMVTKVAQEQALRDGILAEATQEARSRLEAFLQSLPQSGPGQTTYLVELQPTPPR